MKRIIYLTLALLLLFGSISVFAWDSYYPDFEIKAADEFRAIGLPITDIANPTDKLQNMMDFTFVNGKPVYRKYVSGDYPEGTVDFGKSTIELTLVYDKNKLENKEEVFITGTFTYTLVNENGTFEASGNVQGILVGLQTDMSVFDFTDPADNFFSILLQCHAENPNWVGSFVLMPPLTSEAVAFTPAESTSVASATTTNERTADVPVTTTNETITYYYNESDFSHEERPHLPSPYRQGDVAAGVGITTVGIVVVNALTNTSVFGSASFNGSFNPQASPAPSPPSGAGTSAGAASSASAAQSATTASTAGQSTVTSGGGILKSMGDFFKGLFNVLRDMLTDEGRSYASGKVTDILSDTNISNLTDNE